MKSPFSLAAILAIVATLAHSASLARAQSDTETPSLVVLVVVDQLRPGYVTRLRPHFADNGFERLLREGAFFASAEFSNGAASTAPGHATIATGAQPRVHGIVANKWFRHHAARHADDAVVDPACEIVPTPDRAEEGLSPRAMLVPAFGDQLKITDSRNRVFSIGLKDRAAIFLGGLRPDVAVWGDPRTGRFVTSTWYARELPSCVAKFNSENLAAAYAGRTWDRLLPLAAYAGTRPVEPDWLPGYFGLGAAFPHALPPQREGDDAWVQALWTTPYGNDLVIELALRLIDAENMGRADGTDLLCIGLSSNDLCGHAFGPESPEVMDITLRTDRQLGRLFDVLEERVGLSKCLIAVTSDHGATTSPHVAGSLGLGGGQLDMSALCGELNTRLAPYARLAADVRRDANAQITTDTKRDARHRGASNGHAGSEKIESAESDDLSADTAPRVVLGSVLPWVYLNPVVIGGLSPADRAALLNDAADFFRHTDGIAEVFTSLDMAFPTDGGLAARTSRDMQTAERVAPPNIVATGPDTANAALQRARRCYVPGRSGQIYLMVEPFWIPKEKKVASHIGSSRHDRRVPILLYGRGVRPGSYYAPADPADIAVTLAALIGIEPPLASSGRVLHEVIDSHSRARPRE